METTKQKIPVLPLVLCFAFAALARVSGIVYSFIATDVLYSDSIFIYILPMLRQILSALSYSAAASTAMLFVMNARKFTPAVLVYAGVLLADTTTVILYDYFAGVLKRRLLFAIVYRLGLAVYSILILLIGVAIALWIIKKGKSFVLAAITAAVLSSAVDFVTVLWSCIDSLIEWEFLPYTSEIYSMLYDMGTVLLACVLSAAVAVIFVKPRKRKKI